MLEGSTSESACVCKQGFGQLSDSHCEQCPAGKFKSSEQDGMCDDCPEDSSSSAPPHQRLYISNYIHTPKLQNMHDVSR